MVGNLEEQKKEGKTYHLLQKTRPQKSWAITPGKNFRRKKGGLNPG